jgi:AcrR family transcriptional regulator
MSALRERKKAALRATIVRSAVELFVQRGYDAVGMEEIAHASMCSRSTLNRYFGTKEDVLYPAVPEVVAGLRRALDDAPGRGDRWTIARAAVTTQLGQFFENFEPDLRVTIMRLWFTESILVTGGHLLRMDRRDCGPDIQGDRFAGATAVHRGCPTRMSSECANFAK